MKKIKKKDLKQLVDTTTHQLNRLQDRVEINEVIEKLIKELMDTEYASLWVFDKDTATLNRARNDESTNELSMLGQQGVLAKCFFTLSSGIYNYLASEKEYFPAVDNPDNIRIKSKIIVPIIDNDRFLGIVTAYSSIYKIRNFTQDDLDILEALIPFLSNVIYMMYPEMKERKEEEIYISRRLLESSANMVEAVDQIQKKQDETETSDETLTFLSNTVHDIRTPANSLYGFLELLEEQMSDNRLLQYIHNAKESAKFINELTTSILDRVSSQRERQKAEAVTINPTKFIADIAETFSANMYNKKIHYSIYIDPYLPKEITIEDVMLKRVLMNLLNNAYKFTPSKQHVTLSVKYDEKTKQMHVSVIDTGIGIAKEKQKEIFKAFTQAEDNTALNYGGTGLGLNICAEYIHSLGGELHLESELDKGSHFYFTIPLEKANAQPMFQPLGNARISIGILMSKKNTFASKNLLRYMLRMGIEKDQISAHKSIRSLSSHTTHLICFQHQLNAEVIAAAKQKNLPLLVIEEQFLSLLGMNDNDFTVLSQYGYYAHLLYEFLDEAPSMRILIADDDRINIELLKAILSENFCHIDTAMDGEETLELLEQAVKENNPYAVVFLDKHMPLLSGSDVMQRFRSFEKRKGSRPLFAVSISGDASIEGQSDGLFDRFLGKPFTKKAIKETLLQAQKVSS
jgi:signal transduction histidine kinase/CheY-like chemotaxis protein